ncbi:C factor [Rhizobium sp. KAs_5_22]|uniref:SDR family NAD(P)-dependent oxidoreductase n=1 Tax=Ciceribacter selenitireducens TaxID=448181 RepID=UPI0004B6AD6F|nr:SDR family NAD(P)-dependent oxidoreductase [Ciceribacter selenitireducens]PPJ49446.1 C factor [Rhizobium sp. KAs_5_22]
MESKILPSLGRGYHALVLGASGGIGSAFLRAFEDDPACARATDLSRRADGFDVTDEASVADAAKWLDGEGIRFDVIVCATGALTIDGVGPEKSIRAIEADAMAAQFALNAIGPALVLKHFSGLLHRDRRSLMAFLSARVGSIGDNRLGGWISYRAAKAALNQIVRTASIEIARTRPQAVVAALHPGTVATALSDRFPAGHERFTPEDSVRRLLAVLDALEPVQTGGFHAYDGQTIPW